MFGLREALNAGGAPVNNVLSRAGQLGLGLPLSVRDLILVSDQRTFFAYIPSPPGSPLSGWVELTASGNGRYVFRCHVHNGGEDPRKFALIAFLHGEQQIFFRPFFRAWYKSIG